MESGQIDVAGVADRVRRVRIYEPAFSAVAESGGGRREGCDRLVGVLAGLSQNTQRSLRCVGVNSGSSAIRVPDEELLPGPCP